jgi:NAD(P)H-dependent FMN reductase
MITVLSCTNREHNQTQILAKTYFNTLKNIHPDTVYLDFRKLPEDMLFTNPVFTGAGSKLQQVAEDFILPSEKLVFVIPEYNGSYPGILKVFIDGISPDWFRGKKAALIGMATGRAGNLRGMDHLTDVLMHLGVHVMHNRLPVSRFNSLLGEQKEIKDADTLKALERHCRQFIEF